MVVVIKKNLVIVAALLATLLTDVLMIQAQSPRTPRDVVVESNRQELDNLLLRKPILETENRAIRQSTLKQLKTDFTDLQVLNNKMMAKVMGQEMIDYKYVSDMLARIGAKAIRLKSQLALPASDVQPNDEVTEHATRAAEFKGQLLLFDGAVMRFVKNRIFREPQVVELDDGKDASRNLFTIIELSKRLRRDAFTLNKSVRVAQ